MAVTFWRKVFGLILMLDAAVSAGCARLWSWTVGVALLVGAAALLITPYLLIAAALVRASIANKDAGDLASRRADWLRVGLIEPGKFFGAFLAMLTVERTAAPPDASPGPVGRRQPILLIHGILCNRGIWRDWAKALRDAGYSCVESIDLEPMFGDLDGYATDVVAALRDLQNRNDGARVAIIGHSMGGLVARAALRLAGPEVIAGIVTIGSPHHGTAWARNLPFQLTRQMCGGSVWLRALNASQEPNWAVPVTSIYSMQDEFIVPARSAMAQGARNHELHGLGHLELVTSPECMRLALPSLGL